MYKLIMLDYCMADMQGPQVAITISALLESQNLPAPYMCCCSAYDGQTYYRAAISSGMDLFLRKPITAMMIKQVLETVNQ